MSGADLNATSTDGDTALILATYACCTVKGADPGLLDLLACRGVNVNAQNCNGDSPLSIAALHGRTELLSILLQYGKKLSVIHIIISHFKHTSGRMECLHQPQWLRNVMIVCLMTGADAHAANKTGCSPIDFASYCGMCL